MNRITVRLITYGSEDYRRELALRDEILRVPLGMSIYRENLAGETEDFHIGAFRGSVLVGTAVLSPHGGEEMQIRQVAVIEELRGHGIGTRLVRFAQEVAKGHGCRRIVIHARKPAVPFYEKLGYRVEGEEFVEVTVPHRQMCFEL